jgi:hypothetical protein
MVAPLSASKFLLLAQSLLLAMERFPRIPHQVLAASHAVTEARLILSCWLLITWHTAEQNHLPHCRREGGRQKNKKRGRKGRREGGLRGREGKKGKRLEF